MTKRLSGFFVTDFRQKFDFLIEHSKIVVGQSTVSLERVKVLKGGLQRSNHVLKSDFSNDDVEMMLSEDIFAMELQDSLLDLVKKLETKISQTFPHV